ncbi:MAG TPA: hypothetical protein VET23_00935, partial [Chitinophagaceae bacterium]|nr:hypothetical protein [Chitinophagaceae bacterium]
MSAKDTANRIFHFIAGLVLTLLGIILVIMQFSEKWSFTIFPFLILLFDLGWIGVAFEKHKKAQKQV